MLTVNPCGPEIRREAEWPGYGCPPAKLEAPYAFFMLRPQLAFGPDDGRLVVHGVLNEAGKFEQLELVGEAGAAGKNKEPFLNTLRLWEFRPASRGGKPIPVEVLLIIPRPEQP